MKTIFISIPWFLPAFKAGGPIQSIANMVKELDGGYQFYIYTSNCDLHGMPIAVAKTNEWTDFNAYTKVWYAAKQDRSKNLVNEVEKIKPDCLYIIGLFDWHFNIVPLLYARATDKLLSVRGMLHPGALGQKAFKKKIFLQLMKWMKLERKCSFHATDATEAGFIKNVFAGNVNIKVAANFPRLLEAQAIPLKEKGFLKMLSIGIISPMKNYLLVLQALKEIKATVHYDIYGPVKEPAYWEQCLQAIQSLPANITVVYHRELPPHKVPSKLAGHHVFILPSKSENYGHAMVEALSAGLPVITSDGVPWLGLFEGKAGVNVCLNDELGIMNDELRITNVELRMGEEELGTRNDELGTRSDKLRITNVELRMGEEELGMRNDELRIANVELRMGEEELGMRNDELGTRSDKLRITNVEGRMGEEELGMRNDELGIKNEESGMRNVELRIMNDELGTRKVPSRGCNLTKAIEMFAEMGQEEWNVYSKGAVNYIHAKIDVGELRGAYDRMFA